jgi:sterol desaturase/sphingolipid hydroxylase (fatty acid hydroxylase superfamily)
MSTLDTLTAEQKDPKSPGFGIRDEKGHWRPPYPCRYAPLFAWPPRPLKLLRWLFGWPGYLWPINTFFIGLALLTWFVFQPSLAQAVQLRFGWIALMFLRNMILLWIIAGSLHLTLYTLKLHGSYRKYHPQWQAKHAKKFLFNDQVFDNAFRSCVSGVPFWTAYEVLYVWGAANHWWPYISPSSNPVWFVGLFLLIPLWRETHFYFIHKLIHWRPLMNTVHRVHHMNPNPGPWTGLAMHPVEHLLYFSVVAIHVVVPSHPLHFFFNAQLTALTPAMGHHGFEGPLFKGTLVTGSYFHYLHHRFVSCNFGEATVPWDKWLGRFYDGEGTYRTRQPPAE